MTLEEAFKLHEYIKEIEDDYSSDISSKILDIEYKLNLIIEHLQIIDEIDLD